MPQQPNDTSGWTPVDEGASGWTPVDESTPPPTSWADQRSIFGVVSPRQAINSLPYIGGAIGGALGSPGIVTGIGGAALGGAAGEAAKQLISRGLNLGGQPGTSTQAAKSIATQGGLQGAMEGGGQLLGAGVKFLNPVRNTSPVQLLIKALRPSNMNVERAAKNLDTAIPTLQQFQSQSGRQITDALSLRQSTAAAQKSIWSQYQPFLSQISGNTVSTDPVASGIAGTISQRFAEQNPAAAQQIRTIADTYAGRTMNIGEVENRLKDVNRELAPFFSKSESQQYDSLSSARISGLEAERQGLRNLLYQNLPADAVNFRRQYGALEDIEPLTQKLAGQSAKEIPQSKVAALATPLKSAKKGIQESMTGTNALIRQAFGHPNNIPSSVAKQVPRAAGAAYQEIQPPPK